ncbi:aminotransferase class I/II-fold pyridoxal phosphate-dependent enzyme, partial [Aeromonas dhakensis]
LYPGLRLAYLVVPEAQVARFRELVAQLPGAGNPVLQATLADFMDQGHFTRHLSKMRRVYAERHGYLVDALAARLGDRLRVQPQAGGIQLLAQVAGGVTDQQLVEIAQANGLALHALSSWYMNPAQQRGVMMGFANFASAEQADRAVQQLLSLWPAE